MSLSKFTFEQIKEPKTSLDLKVNILAKSLLDVVSLHDFVNKFNSGLREIKSGNSIKTATVYKAQIINKWMPEEFVQIVRMEDHYNDQIILANIENKS